MTNLTWPDLTWQKTVLKSKKDQKCLTPCHESFATMKWFPCSESHLLMSKCSHFLRLNATIFTIWRCYLWPWALLWNNGRSDIINYCSKPIRLHYFGVSGNKGWFCIENEISLWRRCTAEFEITKLCSNISPSVIFHHYFEPRTNHLHYFKKVVMFEKILY